MMKSLLSWFFFIIFSANCFGTDVVSVSGQCQSDQRSLLIQIKNSLKFDSNFSVNLSQWNQNTDCCYWSGVDCDEAGRVISLNLSNESIFEGIENATGLFGLQHLKSLNLAYNRFYATQIPSRLANLTNLTYLNLSNAGFGGQIPIEISNMARLVTLDLSSFSFLRSSLENQNFSLSTMKVENLNFSTSTLKVENSDLSTFPFKFEIPNLSTSGSLTTSLLKLENPNLSLLIQNFTQLRELYLDGVNISAHGSEWCKALSSSLPNLQVLSLSSCFLSGPITSSFAELRSLSVIRLDQNNLSSPVPEFLAQLKNLTSLRLTSSGLQGTFPENIFQVQTLENLDLSNNELLQGSLPHFLQNLSLRTLMLSFTNFSGTLPISISNLKNLSRIELSSCNFTGPIPTSMANLTQMVYLDLSNNSFIGSIPSFHKSENLSYLDLSRNLLTGSIPSSWEQLQNLAYVDLSLNSLDGSIPPSLFAVLSLQKLQLANNQIEGQVPEFLDASSSLLDTLDLSGNRVEGRIPMSVFELQNLKILILSSNKFNGTIHLDKIQGLRNLTRLELSYNRLVVNTSGSDFSILPQITTLRLASCKLRVIPDLKNQSKLFVLDLSDNQISGEVPNWIWEVGNGGLAYLNLSHNLLVALQEPRSILNLSIFVLDLHSNMLQGKMPYPPTVFYVDYSSNKFNYTIETNIGNSLSAAIFFSLSNNSLVGVIPESICNATYLRVLDLSDNNLNGTMPTCLIERIPTLGVLNLRRNKLTGTTWDAFPVNCGLQTLNLNGNQLGGKVPKTLANCKKLEVLDLGNNQIKDKFPCWLKKISRFRVLVLRSNKFYGKIGCSEMHGNWSMLQIVDLASNDFGGKLPAKCLTTWKAMTADEDKAQSTPKHLQFQFLGLSQLYYQDTVTVTSKGLEMELEKILTIFTSIDLSNNEFEGPIPEEMGQFKSLYVLNLSNNALTGPIPSSIGNLRQLESFDLSVNDLNGAIPSQLANLNFLSFLNLSHNHFVGSIPAGTQLQSFSSTSFEGNEGLCGPPLTTNCTTNSSKSERSASALSKEFDWQFIVFGIGIGIGSAIVVAPLMFSDKIDQWYDDHIVDDFLMVILPMFGLLYKTSHQRRIEAEEDLEDENTDEDDDDCDETQTEEFRGRYCVFCSKLDVTRSRVVHDPKCTCHHSLPISSSSISPSSSSLAH